MDIETVLLVIGRVMLASLFVAAGIKHCFVAKDIVPMIAARGIPYPKLVLASARSSSSSSASCWHSALRALWAPLGLAAFTIAATLMLVNFWDMQGPPREHALTCFQYNVAILGGAFDRGHGVALVALGRIAPLRRPDLPDIAEFDDVAEVLQRIEIEVQVFIEDAALDDRIAGALEALDRGLAVGEIELDVVQRRRRAARDARHRCCSP